MSGKRKSVSRPCRHKPGVIVSLKAGHWKTELPTYRSLIRKWCHTALAGRRGDIAVVLADDAFVRTLNRDYRGKDKPTNVLSFPGTGESIGDVVLAYETIRQEAVDQHKSFTGHTAHLVVHGCLHLLGHDHEQAAEAKRMESQEVAILHLLGFPNPYNVPS